MLDKPRDGNLAPGDRFRQVFPPGGATLQVEKWLDSEHVAVSRPNGARQVFPVSTLLNPRYWVRDNAL